MQSARWTSLVLIGLTAAAAGSSGSMAQSPAIYAPTLNAPRRDPERPQVTPPPKVTEKVIVNPGEVSGRAQVLSGDTLRINQTTYRLWGVAAPPMNEFGGYTAMQGLAALIGSQTVICAPKKGFFRGGLQTAQCRVAGGRDLAADLVKRGFARDCPRQSGAAFASIERTAVVDVAGGYKLPDECLAPF
jgi:endonuclease YncB( thermonuclease family)